MMTISNSADLRDVICACQCAAHGARVKPAARPPNAIQAEIVTPLMTARRVWHVESVTVAHLTNTFAARA